MQKRVLIMLLVALVMGGIAVSLVNTAIQQKEGDVTGVSSIAVTKIVVAAVNLEVGTRLSDVMLKVTDWPKESIPEGAFSTTESLIGEEAPVVISQIQKGEAILPYKISGHGARAGLTPRIPSEMRAMTIEVNEVRGVAGFVLPGDRVDVLYTAPTEANKHKYITKAIVQNLLVLGVDQSTSEKEDKPKVVNAVTLLVSAKQGSILTLAQRAGELTLLLRNEGDVTLSTDDNASMNDLNKSADVQKPAKKSTSKSGNYTNVKVIRGLKSTTYTTKVAPPDKATTIVIPETVPQEKGARK